MTAPEGSSIPAVPIPAVYVGDRVVVRYLLGEYAPADWRATPNPAPSARAGGRPSKSDVTGIVLDIGDAAAGTPMLLDRDGEQVGIAHSAITSVRVLSRITVRNSAIRALESAAAKAWPGIESAWIDGWFVRGGGGFTRRANSAIPLEFGARPAAQTLTAISRWYADRGLAPTLAWPDRLLPAALPGAASPPVQVLTAPLDSLRPTDESATADLTSTPPPGWIDLYHYGSSVPADPQMALRVVSAVDGEVVFASIRDGDGIVAIGRGAVTSDAAGTRYLGIAALHTADAHQGVGHARTILRTLLAWGRAEGAATAYVQAEHDNRRAGQWYRRLGFGLHHEYRYCSPE